MKYDNECRDCYYLRDMGNDAYSFSGSDNEKGHCIMQKSCYYPDDTACSYFKDKDNYPSSGCYITTIICDMLGYNDKCNILTRLRYLRDNIMQKDPKYKQALYEYDVIGPQISKEIDIERNYDLMNGILDYYILPAVDLITDKKYSEAINKYTTMTKSLENYYGIDISINISDNYNYQNGGHGKIIKL